MLDEQLEQLDLYQLWKIMNEWKIDNWKIIVTNKLTRDHMNEFKLHPATDRSPTLLHPCT